MLMIERLIKAVRDAAKFNSDAQVAPACILWPDYDRQWEAAIPRLQAEMPGMLILGSYTPEKRIGPAIWIRCVIAGKIENMSICQNSPPILYLPGISRQDLRVLENCPDYLKPVIELQYRGVFWSQANSRDWSILAFLKSDQGGLGLDVAQDRLTLDAMKRALSRLLDEDIDMLEGKHLDNVNFNKLLTGDPVRDLLQWLDQGEAFRATRADNEWSAFVAICTSQLAFDPDNDGALVGAAKLANRKGAWQPVWDRFCDAPKRYPNIPELIRKNTMPTVDLLSSAHTHGSWPQWNDDQEAILRYELTGLGTMPAHDARKRLADIEARHCNRRDLVWAEIGDAPLACALKWLAILADTTANSLAAGTLEDMVSNYCIAGWCADDAVLRALAFVAMEADVNVVLQAIRAIYLPWLEDSARYLQKSVETSGYPGNTVDSEEAATFADGECILFVDGLRYDMAQRLIKLLTQRGYQIDEALKWTALPSVTDTGKPAVTPVRGQIHGEQANADFEPCVAATGQPLKGGYHLKKLITDAGWIIIDKSETGNGLGRAWCECHDIDHEGHDRGWKLAKHLDSILAEIRERIEQLFNAGWKRIRVVTDHGWLLMPGGLPKTDLAAALVENKRGRCAAIKPGAVCDEHLYPWYWNPEQHFALADGISCYRSGEEYAHGGLSLQECLTLELVISPPDISQVISVVQITDVAWKGLRCKVAVDGEPFGLLLDIRKQPGNPSSSVVMSKKPLSDEGIASVVVEDESQQDTEATVVLVNQKGELVAQISTVIGGGNK